MAQEPVAVRPARPADLEARQRLLRATPPAPLRRAFLHLLLQEVTLQALVLCGAALFIFCGLPWASCVALTPLAGALLLLLALLDLDAAKRRRMQCVGEERAGLVAECGGLVVGTASLREEGHGGRLCALAVAAAWRGRGAGGALARAAAAEATARRWAALGARVSELQPEARALLHRQGWQCLGAYRRPLCLGAASLAVARLTLPLPA